MRRFSDTELVKMYREMMLGRVYQETMLSRIAENKMPRNFFHLSVATESLSVGIWNAMQPCDYIMPTHRMHALFTSMLDLTEFTTELMGRVTGYCHGKSFEFSTGVAKAHMLPKESLLASGSPYCVGAALALKLDKKEGVVITCCGDGTTSEGNIHEAMNLASVLKVPIVFVIDNNGWAISQPLSKQCAITDLAKRAAGYNMRGVTADGQDVLVVRDVMEDAIALAREGQPNVVEFKTIRHRGHFEGDSQKYRDDLDIIEPSLNNDCIKRLQTMILEKGILTEADAAAIRSELQKTVADAFAYAETQPWPSEDETLDPSDVYATIPGGTK